MTSSEFNNLEENIRASTLWEDGVLIEERIIGKSQVKIYAMKGFFVEVWMDTKKLKLEKIHALDAEPKWSSYLDKLKP